MIMLNPILQNPAKAVSSESPNETIFPAIRQVNRSTLPP